MSVTFQADISKFPVFENKIWLADHYGLEEEYFVGDPYAVLDPETNKHYEIRKETACDFIYEHNVSNDFFNHIMNLIDRNIAIQSSAEGNIGSIKFSDIQTFRKKVFLAFNKFNGNYITETVIDGNMIHMGYSEDRIKNTFSSILNIIDNAYKHKLDIFWG